MQNSCCSPETRHNLGLLFLRLAIGLVFVVQGWGKLNNIDMVTGMLGGIGFFAPAFWAWLLALVEFVGGIFVILGIFPKAVAKFFVIIMVVALLTVHRGGPFQGSLLPLTLLGSSLALLCLGGGKWSLVKKDCSCKLCGGKDSCDCTGHDNKKMAAKV